MARCRCLLLALLVVCSCSAIAQISFRQVSAAWTGEYLTRADVNQDGLPDLVGANYGLYVLINNGDGSFQPVRRSSTEYAIRSLQAADIDRDGKADIISCANDPFSVTGPIVWRGDGAGGFTPSSFLATDGCQAVAVGDVNGDGFADIVSVYPMYPDHNGVDVFLNDGHGNFTTVVNQGIEVTATYGDCIFVSVTAGDFDHDGHGDLVIGATCAEAGVNSWGAVIFARGDGAGRFSFSIMHEHEENYDAVLRDDIDQNGWWDALTWSRGSGAHSTDTSEIRLFRNSATGWPVTWAETSVATGYSYAGDGNISGSGVVADVDGNGIKDVAFPSANYGVCCPPIAEFDVVRGLSDGTFAAAQTFPLAEPAANLISGDFDRDGRIDFAMQSGGDSTVILLNRSTAPTCAADPVFRSVKVCSPAQLSGNVLHLLANSTAGVVTGMKVYVDNTLALYTPNDLVNRNLALTNGGHRITVRAWDAIGSFSSARWVNVNTSFGCSLPATNRSIHLCFPTNNSTVGSPMQVVAAVRDSNTYYGARVYVDGGLKYSVLGKQVNANLTLPLGTHKITIQAHDQQGYFSQTLYASVR